jgi:2-methylcitrate dehydratase PrpD
MSSQLLCVLKWIIDTDLDKESQVLNHAKWLVLDTMGCVMAGIKATPVSTFITSASLADAGNFKFLPTQELGLSASNAAMALALAACWDEACEGHAGAHGRPGVAVLAALIPLSSKLTYKQFLKSFLVGYEIGARMGASLRINKGMHVDGNWPALGAAAAVAHAMGLPIHQIAAAIELAACQMPMSLYLPIVSGSTARNTYLGHAAQLGQTAAMSITSGITAPTGAVQEYAHIGLGKEALPLNTAPPFQILQAYFKPYAAVRHVHYGALAAHELRHSLEVEKIQAIVLKVYEEATVYCGNRAPQTPLQAQFSLSFGVAAMLKWGRLDPWVYREPQFHDPQLKRLEAMVEVEVNPVWTTQLIRAAHLSVQLKDGTKHIKEISSVPGDQQMPFTKEALLTKFSDYCQGSLSHEQAQAWSHQLLDAPTRQSVFHFWN